MQSISYTAEGEHNVVSSLLIILMRFFVFVLASIINISLYNYVLIDLQATLGRDPNLGDGDRVPVKVKVFP